MGSASEIISREALIDLLHRVQIFSEVGDSDLADIADQLSEINYKSGQSVFKKGDEGDAMYIILEGAVQIIQEEGGSRFVQAQLGRGNFFGEMAIVSDQPRAATVAAAVPTVLLPVDKDDFLEKVRTDPAVALHTIQILILRLRRSLQMLS